MPGATISISDTASGGHFLLTNPNTSLWGTTVLGVTGGIDSIKYVVTNSCGTAIAIRVITINPLPVVGEISGPATVCIRASIT